jgi:hypothetical protein
MHLRDVPCLIPRSYLVTGYDGRPRRHTFTAADAKSAAATLNAQLKAGLRIPVCWMHDPDAEPEYVQLSHKDPDYLRQWQIAKGYIGDAQEAVVKGDRMHVRVGIPDDKDARQFDKIGTVSPSLVYNWTDERGQTWSGLNVLHIGVTPKPVQRDLPRATAYRKASLSHAVWFSISIPTGSPVMADETEINNEGDSGSGDIAQAVELLKKLNPPVVLSGDITDMRTFLVALETSVNTLNGGEMEDDLVEMEPDGDETEPVSMPAFMSHYLPTIEANEKDNRRNRIQALIKSIRADKADGDRMLKMLDEVKLSHEPGKHFDKFGKMKPLKVDAIISFFESKPAPDPKSIKFKSAAHLSHTVPVAPVDRTPTGNSVDEAVAEVEKYTQSKK